MSSKFKVVQYLFCIPTILKDYIRNSSKLLTFNAGCHRRHVYNISRFLFKHLQKNTYVMQMQTILPPAGAAK